MVEQWLKVKTSVLNNKLHRDGFLFLNTVYRELGFDETKAGQVVGWIDNKKTEEKTVMSISDQRNSEMGS
ncbi:DUF6353 family protein [Allobaculum sp. Allo2]|uniref:DUF6353 family protein n=1 Tax=Allobaculum sp. Allo2 TaxID=2853432 RepID=UPI003462C4B5